MPIIMRITDLLHVQDLFADCLSFLDESTLLTCELVSRNFRRIILYRRSWKHLFDQRVTKDKWIAPITPPEDWKVKYWKFNRELKLYKLHHRNSVSARFIWRYVDLKSIKFEDTSAYFCHGHKDGRPLRWKIILQNLEDRRQTGIFLQQETPDVNSFFTVNLLTDDYETICSQSTAKEFKGGSNYQDSTCGWFFPQLRDAQSLIVVIDLTVFGKDMACLAPLYQLISNDLSENLLKNVLSYLGDFCTHVAEHKLKARRYLQENAEPLVRLLEDESKAALLRASAAGTLWNSLDTSELYISVPLVKRITETAVRMVQKLQKIYSREGSESDEEVEPGDAELVGPNSNLVRVHLVNTVTGMMFNLPIVKDFREVMAATPGFFRAVMWILSCKEFCKSHFTCIHILAMFHHQNMLPNEFIEEFGQHLDHYIDASTRDEFSLNELGVLLSIRDVADFFVALLLSQQVECVKFGSWCLRSYYKCKSQDR
jgi:hypothetical protein